MKHYIFIWALFPFLLALTACWDDKAAMEATPNSDLLRTADVAVAGDDTRGVIHVEANCAWTATTEAAWVSLDCGGGNGTGDIVLTLTENPSPTDARTATVLLKTVHGVVRPVTVRQLRGALLTVSPTSLSVPSLGGQYSVRVTSNKDWTLRSDCNWLTGFSTTSGGEVSAMDITFVCQDNTSLTPRTGTIIVETQDQRQSMEVAITQAAGELPVVGTLELQDCTGTQAMLACASVSSMYPVTEYGICFSATENPTTADPKTVVGTPAPEDGTFQTLPVNASGFTATLTGLTSGSTYHARAYAISAVGTAYGPDFSFDALPMPGNGDNPRPQFVRCR